MLTKLHQHNRQILVIILFVSVILRVLASLYIGNEVVDLPGTFDQISYHNLALRVQDGHGFSFGQVWWPMTPADEPTAHWSFLYTLYLVLVYSIFGVNPIAARIIQAIIIGILHPLLAYMLGKRIFGTIVGLIAAGLTAIYIYFVYYAGTLMTEPFYISAILVSLLFSIVLVDQSNDIKENQHRGYLVPILLGLALGMTVLLRQLFLVIIPFVFLWILWSTNHGQKKSILLQLSAAGLIIIALILPFTIYNYNRFDRFVFLNTNAGFAFFWANHPIYGTTYYPLLPSSMGTYQDLIPVELRQLNEAALDQELLKLGIQQVISDPIRYMQLSLSRVPHYFMFWPSSGSGMISNISRVASFGLLWPFMLYGWIMAICKGIRPPKPDRINLRVQHFISSPTFLLSLFIVLYSGIHLLSWSLIRYRLPVDAVLLVFAAYGILELGNRICKLGIETQPSNSSEII